MHNHYHHGCEHYLVAYCSHCNVTYCKSCGKEWGQYNYPYIAWQGGMGTGVGLGTSTPSYTGGTHNHG